MSYFDELLEELQPYADADPEGGADTLAIIEGLAEMAEPVASIVRDSEDGPGWSALFDPQRCPSDWLAIPAQIVGVRLILGLDDEVQRQRIEAEDGMHRGRITAQVSAAMRTLTGTQSIVVRERYPTPWKQTFITRTDETPDAAATLAALKSQKPIGLVTILTVADGQDWQAVKDSNATWADVKTNFTNWDAVRLADPS